MGLNVAKNSSLILSMITAIIFYLTSRALFNDGLMYGHDAYAQATYTKLFYQSLSEGQFPVRWIEHVWIGFGQPLFNFYQVGFNYLFSLIHFFVPDFLLSIKISVFLSWWIGGLFVYLFAKKYGNLSAFLAFVVYMFSPYIVLDIFIRASYPELLALSFIPGVFWAIDKILDNPKIHRIPILALILAVVIFSHLPTLVIFLPLILGYIILRGVISGIRRESILFTISGGLLATGIASFYFLPALLQINLVSLDKLQSGIFDYKGHFVDPFTLPAYIWGYSAEWWGNSFPGHIFIGIIPWLIVIASLGILIFRQSLFLKKKLEIFFWISLIAYTFFFATDFSSWIWERMNFLQFIQHPWRFYMVVPLATAMLAGLLLKQVRSYDIKMLFLLIVFFLQLVFVSPFLAPADFIKQSFWNLPFNQWKTHPEVRKLAHFEPGYSPRKAGATPQNSEFDKSWESSNLNINVAEKALDFTLKEYDIESDEEGVFVTRIPYYPDWNAYIDGKKVNTEPFEPYNFLSMDLPQGSHTLRFQYINQPLVDTANLISLLSLVLTIGILVLPVFISVFALFRNMRASLKNLRIYHPA